MQGEYSYRPKQPVQISSADLLVEILTNGTANQPTGIIAPTPPGFIVPGTFISGFKNVEFHQAQATATHTFGPQLKANQLTGVIEAGYTYQKLPNNIAFNAAGTDFAATTAGAKGYQTRNSYGYRAVVRADYLNAIGPVNLSPRVAFSHDLRGISSTFNQGVKAASIGVAASYQNNWQADLSYTNFFGGETYNVTGTFTPTSGPGAGTPVQYPTSTTNNLLSDRDFIAATVSYSF